MITLRKPAEVLSSHLLSSHATPKNRAIILKMRLRKLWKSKKEIELLLAEFDVAIDRDEARLRGGESVLDSEASCSS